MAVTLALSMAACESGGKATGANQPVSDQQAEATGASSKAETPETAPKSESAGPFDGLTEPPPPVDAPVEVVALEAHLREVPMWYDRFLEIPKPYIPKEAFDTIAKRGITDAPTRFLLCDVDLADGVRPDSFAKPELELSLVTPDRSYDFTRANNTRVAFYGVELDRGATLDVRLRDKDGTGADDLGGASATFEGAYPIAFDSKLFTARCWEFTDADLAERLRRYSLDAQAHLESVARLMEKGLETFEYPVRELGEAESDIERLAGLLGWGDPRVQRLVDWRSALHERWVEHAGARVSTVLEDASTSGSWTKNPTGTFSVRLLETTCPPPIDAKRGRRHARYKSTDCTTRIEVRNESGRTVEQHAFFERGYGTKAAIIHRSGNPVRLDAVRFERGEERVKELALEPDASVVVRFRLDSSDRPPPEILDGDRGDFPLLRVGGSENSVFFIKTEKDSSPD